MQEKLRSLCTELAEKVPNEAPKLKKLSLQTVGEFAKNLAFIADLVFKLTGNDSIIDLFKDLFEAIASLCK
jgi:hypothetical protein